LFVTITCSSRFPNTYAKFGGRNPKWNGSTHYEAQQYLNDMWARVLANLNRKDIKLYGFRIAEPQHDAIPHWHMLVFLKQHQTKQFKAVIEHNFRENGDKAALRSTVVTLKRLITQKAAQRVEVWASCWVIRQLQQLMQGL
tara:strand:+ start:8243 stop:8665 length:423 start_codon:yes stop_codon:yes gene_type:complete